MKKHIQTSYYESHVHNSQEAFQLLIYKPTLELLKEVIQENPSLATKEQIIIAEIQRICNLSFKLKRNILPKHILGISLYNAAELTHEQVIKMIHSSSNIYHHIRKILGEKFLGINICPICHRRSQSNDKCRSCQKRIILETIRLFGGRVVSTRNHKDSYYLQCTKGHDFILRTTQIENKEWCPLCELERKKGRIKTQ